MEVFVKLVHKGTRTPLNDDEPALIAVPAGSSKVGHLKEAVHRRCYRAVGHVDADALRVCDPDGLEGAYVATHAPLSAIDPAKIYFVEVPPVSEAKIGVAPPPVVWTVQLVHRGTRSPFNKIGPVAILAPPGYKTVGPLLATVHQQCHHAVGHIDAFQLKMAAPDDLEREYLDVLEPIEPIASSAEDLPNTLFAHSAYLGLRENCALVQPQLH